MRIRHLGWVSVNGEEYKASIKEGHLVLAKKGKPRDLIGLSLEHLCQSVLTEGTPFTGGKKKQIDHPEFRF